MDEFSDDDGSGLELVHISDVLDYLGEIYYKYSILAVISVCLCLMISQQFYFQAFLTLKL